MPIFITGCGLFALGVVLIFTGRAVQKRSRLGGELDKWFAEVVRHWFDKLTSKDTSAGERLVAVGAIVAALGLVVALAGLGAWVSAVSA